jgi:hypothetical protein
MPSIKERAYKNRIINDEVGFNKNSEESAERQVKRETIRIE